jgi:glycosyltransferase involved in cell wall biosynthesis
MVRVGISVITPTLGRSSLTEVIRRTGEQMAEHDQHIIVLDSLNGSPLSARRQVAALGPRYWYSEHGNPRSFSGAAQRDVAMGVASGSHLWFVDDDDLIEPGAFEEIREAVARHPDRPHFFPMERTGIWFDHVIWEQGRMGGSQIIWPNVLDKLPTWMPPGGPSEHGADMQFTRRLLEFYPEGPIEHDYFILVSPVGHIQGHR